MIVMTYTNLQTMDGCTCKHDYYHGHNGSYRFRQWTMACEFVCQHTCLSIVVYMLKVLARKCVPREHNLCTDCQKLRGVPKRSAWCHFHPLPHDGLSRVNFPQREVCQSVPFLSPFLFVAFIYIWIEFTPEMVSRFAKNAERIFEMCVA